MLPHAAAPWFKISRLEVLITNACDPSLPEPNYAHHLEIAEFINSKKANTPREAVMLIARLGNHRNPHIAILALSLLNTLVQSCGYPLHLQIATKDFLNELVRRFPERPPPFPGPVMSRILELIHGWKEGICAESRWKEDLGNIRDMHRLLTFKGYRFRELSRRDVPENTMSIKSADELENEDREAQSAKLQELIRRGTPRDLAAAQELMKSLAGANPEAKPDYRSQSLSELAKLQSKVVLLNEMLDNVDAERGERWAKGDAYDQVASVLKSARPKLQKWVSDAETEDPESLNAFLEANDQINTALSRFEAFQKGDFAAVASIPTTIGSGSGSGGGGEGGLSLIDFDDGDTNGGASGSGNTVDDLMGLFSQPPPAVNNATRPPTQAQQQPQSGPIMLPGTPSPSNGATNGATPALGQSQFMGMMQPKPTNQPMAPAYGSGVGMGAAMAGPRTSSLGAATPPSGPATPPGLSGMQAQTMGALTGQRPQAQPAAAQGKDPFADLAGLF
ncbi:hypothetical protein HYDPIDRAFT_133359 [Hydnomerulius pinastri MD-312]|uniref:VHS domain-containing protein n=1 Tax=Hydnomerulius pinastri MD-312 TaxID=994086 RepID=A0A0C9W8U9_9AGAM|nr:hypothetical protein HYDPIDRAFT_133359 [Hydnomerulius pinastri MD-312]